MEGKDWVEAITSPALISAVPEDVQALFGVARGAMVYGFLFYPLYTLAAELLFRVAEAAVSHKCSYMDAPKRVETLADRIKWLNENGAISDDQLLRWHATRELRNIASHPKGQSIMTPGNAIGYVERTAELINPLFGGA
jgi:hypothetical protein